MKKIKTYSINGETCSLYRVLNNKLKKLITYENFELIDIKFSAVSKGGYENKDRSSALIIYKYGNEKSN